MSRGWQLLAGCLAAAGVTYAVLARIFDVPAEGVQITWTCIGVAGGIVCGANLVDSWIDLKVLSASGRNGELRILARGGIWKDAILFSQMCFVVLIGVMSLLHGPTLTAAQRAQLHIPTWTWTSLILTAGIIAIVLGCALLAIIDRSHRLMFYSAHGIRPAGSRDRVGD